MLAAYIHEIEDDDGCTAGGLAGTTDSFMEMGREWTRMLVDFGIRSLRMDHLAHRTGDFTNWDIKRVNSLLEVAAGIIVRRASSVHGYFIDKQEFQASAPTAGPDCRISAALKTVAACGAWGRQSSSTCHIPIIFDKDTLTAREIHTLSEVARAEGTLDRFSIGNISSAGAEGYATLQAAALVAAECRQEFLEGAEREQRFRPFRTRFGRGRPTFKRVPVEELLRR